MFSMKKLTFLQFVILLSGTIFAWYNWAQDYISWTQSKVCSTGCSATLVNPFTIPCFYGAIVFTIAFLISLIMVIKVLKKN